MTLEKLISIHSRLELIGSELREGGEASGVASNARVKIMQALTDVETLVGRKAVEQ